MKDPKLIPKYKVVTKAYLLDPQQTTRDHFRITKSEESVFNLDFDLFFGTPSTVLQCRYWSEQRPGDRVNLNDGKNERKRVSLRE